MKNKTEKTAESAPARRRVVLVGKYPIDKDAFWKLVKGVSRAEANGKRKIDLPADQLAEAGIPEAVEEMRVFAGQEKHHDEATEAILKKYAPEYLEKKSGAKTYVCPLCGFEHEGDLDKLPADWKCPVCGVGKAAFKEQA